MNDDTVRIASFDGKFPVGTWDDEILNFTIQASPGIHEEQPAIVPLRFISVEDVAPAGYETIALDAVFTDYQWNEQEQLASWEANLVGNGVVINPTTIMSGDGVIAID